MSTNEKSFPRGGTINSDAKTAENTSNIIFGATQKKIKKAQKPKDNLANELTEDVGEQLQAVSAETLTFDTLQEDMLVMGVVKETSSTSIKVALPGRITARVLVADISEAYTNTVKSAMAGDTNEYYDLTDLFSVGRIVCGRAYKTQKLENNRTVLLLSLKPANIHAGLLHRNIKKGFVFTGAVSEKQEHGYVIETGIHGLQAFVPQEQQTRHIGELIFLKVSKIQHSENQSTCTCQEIDQNMLKIKSQYEANLDYILPGSIVKLKVEKHLKNGLQGTIMNESFTAYVNEHHLADPLQTPNEYEAKAEYRARVLYVMPLSKLVYLTLNLDIKTSAAESIENDAETVEEELLKEGSIVEKARVLRIGTGGIVMLLNNKYKGLISFNSIKSILKGNYDQDEVLARYARKTKHKVRILGYDIVESLFYCSDDPNVVNEKLYSLEDIKPGDFVSARIVQREEKISGYSVKIGRIHGVIEQLFLAPNIKYEPGLHLRCRVVDVNFERKTCYLTNRNEYLSKGAKVLTTLQAAQVGNVYTGTIVKCQPEYVLVKFFGGIKGVLHSQRLKDSLGSHVDSFLQGQTTRFRIYGKNKDQITLTLPEDKFKLGEICPIEITNSLDAGIEIRIATAENSEQAESETETFVGLVPLRLLSDHIDLAEAQKRVHVVGSKTKAACITQNIFSLRDVPYFCDTTKIDWSAVEVGDILRAYVKNISDQIVELMLPIRNYNKLVKVHEKMLRMKSGRDVDVSLAPEQVIYCKVLSKVQETKTLTVSAQLTDVWNGKLSETAKFVEGYLNEVQEIKAALKKQAAPIARYSLGEKVSARFVGVDPDTNDWVYTLVNSKVTALLNSHIAGASPVPTVGAKEQVVVLWIDYSRELVRVSNKEMDINHISAETVLPKNLMSQVGLKAKVLLKLDSILICSLKKSNNPLIICPVRLHYNDIENSACAGLRPGDFCNLAFIHEKLPIAVPEFVWKVCKNAKRVVEVQIGEVPIKPKKLKLESAPVNAKKSKVSATPALTNGKVKLDNGKTKLDNGKTKLVNGVTSKTEQLFFEDKKPAKCAAASAAKTLKEAAEARLPGVASFWDSELPLNGDNYATSSDEEASEDNEDASAAKKKRLSHKEKQKAQFKEEQRLSEIERRNADVTQCPESIDEFERALLGRPNDSFLWIQYIAFMLSNTEVDKARAVARRALKTIVFRESNEIMNVWCALLNLEIIYNTNNFDDVLNEALTCNDPLEIHLRTVDLLLKAQRKDRLLELLTTMLRKFKTELRVWRVAADAYFALDLKDEVKNMLQRAIKVLPNHEHINCIVAFAKLFAKYDDHAMAQTLIDDIVTSYPKRTDIWVLYVDMLVKAQLIDSARNVLERAVQQKLRPNKMRIIYKKYLDFEEQHGTVANAVKVKEMALQYVTTVNSAA